ncbi:MAG: amidohydrolase [Robiginitomaculum sp.]|nr:MAG: amidohydrolase [Robiginitomaculum sp.]
MRAACIQLCSGLDIDANIDHTDTLIRKAHKAGARFVATPENTHFMGGGAQALFAAISPEADCRAVAHFGALAKELSIDLLIGSLAVKLSDTKAANRSFLFGPDGLIKARYDKLHMFDVEINEVETWRESANYTAGTKAVLADVADIKLGLSICYDLRFAALYKHYAKSGAQLLSVPSAFTAVTGEAHWQVLLRARATETSAYVIAPAQGGIHADGRATWGHSLIIDPWGKVLAGLDHDKPGYCLADIDPSLVADIRRRLPAWQQETILP